jgi:hypothetical protein
LPKVNLPNIPWGKRWVVHAKAAMQGSDRVLEYLGRYMHRTALTDKSILACTDGDVTFAYRDSQTHQRKTMTLGAHEFLRRFLQHVPPKGLHRVRSFGLLHPSRRQTLRRLQLLLMSRHPVSPTATRERQRRRCPHCHGDAIVLLSRLTPEQCFDLAARNPMTELVARGPPPVTLPTARIL